MPPKKFPRNARVPVQRAPCPSDSGKKYRDCCYDKGFEYLVDEDGTILKSMPMSDDLAEVIEEQKRKFQEGMGEKLARMTSCSSMHRRWNMWNTTWSKP